LASGAGSVGSVIGAEREALGAVWTEILQIRHRHLANGAFARTIEIAPGVTTILVLNVHVASIGELWLAGDDRLGETICKR